MKVRDLIIDTEARPNFALFSTENSQVDTMADVRTADWPQGLNHCRCQSWSCCRPFWSAKEYELATFGSLEGRKVYTIGD